MCTTAYDEQMTTVVVVIVDQLPVMKAGQVSQLIYTNIMIKFNNKIF